jgi:hypothetical protein
VLHRRQNVLSSLGLIVCASVLVEYEDVDVSAASGGPLQLLYASKSSCGKGIRNANDTESVDPLSELSFYHDISGRMRGAQYDIASLLAEHVLRHCSIIVPGFQLLNSLAVHITIDVNVTDITILIAATFWAKYDRCRTPEWDNNKIARGHVSGSHTNQALLHNTEGTSHHSIAEVILQKLSS